MSTSTDTKRLFSVTIRRTYTPAYQARWSNIPETSDSSHPEWADSPETIVAKWAEIHGQQQPYWLEKFSDELLMVEPLNTDERRREAQRHETKAHGGPRCCDLAVVYPCVCAVAFSCPEHGVSHNGTHD